MYVSRRNLVFRPLGRLAPVAVNSGLRPETLGLYLTWPGIAGPANNSNPNPNWPVVFS